LQLAFGLKKPRFQILFDKGQRQDSTNLRILSYPGNGGLGIATSKKIGCHARRNHCKRKIVAIIREAQKAGVLEQNNELQGENRRCLTQNDWAVVVKKDICNVPYQALVTEVLTAFYRSSDKWEEKPH